MSYQGDLRRKMLELKHLNALSYKSLSARVGIDATTLQQFGSQKMLLSDAAKAKLAKWIQENGGGYVYMESNPDVVH